MASDLGLSAGTGADFSSYAWPSISRAIWRVVEEAESRSAVGLGLGDPRRVSDPAVGYETEAVKQAVHDLVARMPEPLQQVLTASYGLNESGPSGVRPIGARLGLSRERVRQLRQEGLVWLRHPGHSVALRTLLGRHKLSDYEQAYQQAQAWRQSRRRRYGR